MIDKGVDSAIDSVASMHVLFLTDEMVFRFVYRWTAAVARAGHAVQRHATQSPFITLQTRA